MEQSVLRVSLFINVVSHCTSTRLLFGGVQNAIMLATPPVHTSANTTYK